MPLENQRFFHEKGLVSINVCTGDSVFSHVFLVNRHSATYNYIKQSNVNPWSLTVHFL